MKHTRLADLDVVPVSHNPRIRKQMMLGFGELEPLVQFSRAVFPPGESAPGHQHPDMAEVFFVESGNGSILIDGTPMSLHPGDCITVHPGEQHELSNPSNAPFTVIYFGIKTR